MIIIGPGLNTGIGQLCKKYTRLFGNESVYYVFGKELPECEAYKKPSLYDNL